MLCKYEEEKYEHDQSKYEQLLREMPLECCARIPEQEEIKKTQTGRIKQLNSLHENSFNEENNFGQSRFISDDNLYYASFNDFDYLSRNSVISVKKEQVISVELNSRPKILTTQMSIKEENLTTKHIMISYNSKSKETCLKIKNKLQENGFQTWIDVENICGSSLESMAKAIEESHCVLMCMTEKYKESANCRLEAEYSVKLNKPIIPLIMEKGYQPDGWLGIILGLKIFIDFTKYEITECFKRLEKEIDNLVKNGKIPKPEKVKNPLVNHQEDISKVEAIDSKHISFENINKPSNMPVKKIKKINPCRRFRKIFCQNRISPKVSKWSENEVNEWIKENNFHEEIIRTIYPCNGEYLARLHEMYLNIPEYFYNCINFEKRVHVKDLVHFSNELIKLFN